MSRIYRYEVPVDGNWHTIGLHGDPIAVGCRQLGVVEFWAVHQEGALSIPRNFIVEGTGHLMPAWRRHWGTAVAPGGELVWHLLEGDR